MEMKNNRALNDYTADRVTPPEKWIEPKKVAMCISTVSPGESVDLKHRTQGKEVDTTSK